MATSTKLPPNPFLHEILEVVSKQRTKTKKIEILKKYECDALKSVLIWNFDETASKPRYEDKFLYGIRGAMWKWRARDPRGVLQRAGAVCQR